MHAHFIFLTPKHDVLIEIGVALLRDSQISIGTQIQTRLSMRHDSRKNLFGSLGGRRRILRKRYSPSPIWLNFGQQPRWVWSPFEELSCRNGRLSLISLHIFPTSDDKISKLNATAYTHQLALQLIPSHLLDLSPLKRIYHASKSATIPFTKFPFALKSFRRRCEITSMPMMWFHNTVSQEIWIYSR